MEELNLRKQKLNYESKIIEGVNEFASKGEYLIPDIHPDVDSILMVDVKTKILNTEAFADKIFVEGEFLYNIIYVAKDEEKNNTYNVSYSDKFNLYIETFGMKKENPYNINVSVVNINSNLLNERKVSIDSIVKFNSVASELSETDIMCDLAGEDDIQLLMRDMTLCELKGNFSEELSNETLINISMDKDFISKILICDSYIYKTECKLLENKIVYNAYCRVKILYVGGNSGELCYLEQDVYLTKDVDCEDVSSDMFYIDNWDLINSDYMIDEDDSGESRIINVYLTLKCDLKLIYKNTLSVIDDAYSKNSLINLVKNTYKFNCVDIYDNVDTIVKENINVDDGAVNIVYCTGKCVVNSKKVLEGKVVVEGVVKSNIIYKTNSENKALCNVNRDIPFTLAFEDSNIRIDVDIILKCNLENIEAFIEAKTIGVKAILSMKMYSNSEVKKDILIDIYRTQDDIPVKDSSIIIYVVGEEDTLWSIAKKYCVSIEDICRINDLEQGQDILGYKLLIPSKAIF